MKNKLIKKLLKQGGTFIFLNRFTGKLYFDFSYQKIKWFKINKEELYKLTNFTK